MNPHKILLFLKSDSQKLYHHVFARNEQPEKIIKDIMVGVEIDNNIQVILDRKIAINTAITTLNEDEVLLIAGKGHETTQIIGSEVLPFSDIEIALDALI